MRLSNRFGQFRSLHSTNKNTARSFQCDQAALPLSLRLPFLRSALAFKLLSDGDWLVTDPQQSEDRVFQSKPYLPTWVGDHPTTWPEASELDVPPPPHCYQQQAVKLLTQSSYHLPVLSHIT